MATKRIIIAEIKNNDQFFNIKSNEGVEYGISKQYNPELSKKLIAAKQGDEIEAEVVEKNGKFYLKEVKAAGSGGGKTFAPKDKGFDAAIEAAKAAATFHSLDKDRSDDKLIATAEKLHAWILSKKSA